MNQVLNREQILQKIRRIAFEIYENNYEEEQLIMAGIEGQGYVLAVMLQQQLQEISGKEIQLVKVSVDKSAPSESSVELDCQDGNLAGKAIVLADDVLNTGKTLAYSLKPFLESSIKKLEIAVLVNRSHTSFPVQAKYTGYELATTLTEHIEVVLQKDNMAVYLK